MAAVAPQLQRSWLRVLGINPPGFVAQVVAFAGLAAGRSSRYHQRYFRQAYEP